MFKKKSNLETNEEPLIWVKCSIRCCWLVLKYDYWLAGVRSASVWPCEMNRLDGHQNNGALSMGRFWILDETEFVIYKVRHLLPWRLGLVWLGRLCDVGMGSNSGSGLKWTLLCVRVTRLLLGISIFIWFA